MDANSWDEFEQRVSCDESLHVDSEAMPWPDAQAHQARLAERNLNTLSAVAALEERYAETDDDSPLMLEIQRMDAKLTALVDIVNHLLVPASVLPPRQALRFNAVGAVLPAALVPGDTLVVRLRFDVCRSLPLELAARVERRLDNGHVFVVFAAPGDVLGDAIERLVFRHHRRKVAETRQLTS
ncbi:hypothetical protein ASD22_14760 [Rhodanobacter sp. Root480]|jgi:hypothetical protein|uniref:PilZ domain-containing protein n=1 Tax=Rhodanobacter ginsenosidimutans TaxID=490571 RepID=A0ABW0JY23_9GAMM|nr:PilZ domain-containing protein [Rhodanobacter sp. Root480]KQX95144.1 hypothetical protein ASD22_14760 [Rhodanobacter sp. Root480]